MSKNPFNSPVILFKANYFGTRLLFQQGQTNPRNLLGKNGVTLHNKLTSLFHKTITIEAPLMNEKGLQPIQSFIINRNSLIKYIGPQASNKDSDEVLIQKLNQTLYSSPLNQPSQEDKLKQIAAGSRLRHAGEYNSIKLQYSLSDSLAGKFLSWIFQKTIKSLNAFKARFLILGTEESLFKSGEILAKARFSEAYAAVPAYKNHIARFQGQAVNSLTFKDLPQTTKDNYIKYQQHDSDTHFYGKYPIYSKVDTSTGTTGKSTAWVRSEKELKAVKRTLLLAEKYQFGARKMACINAFALGPWATGLTSYEVMRSTGNVFATGPDKDKILDELLRIQHYENHQLELEIIKLSTDKHIETKDAQLITEFIKKSLHMALRKKHLPFEDILKQEFNSLNSEHYALIESHKSKIFSLAKKMNQAKVQILLSAYPPFLKEFAAFIKSKNLNLSDFSIVGVIGGQANSEAIRETLIKDGFIRIYSSYGASDLDINLGSENDEVIELRKILEANPGLARELYGVNRGLPMIFHFDPFNVHIECEGKEDDLIFTCTRNDRSSPRIRYNLGDKGRVYAASDVQALLAKYGIFQQFKSPLPLLFVWGRDSTVVFNGANLAFTELERAVANTDTEQQIVKKAFYCYQDKEGTDQLEFWLELNEGSELSNSDMLTIYTVKLFKDLINMNQDFRYQIEHLGEGAALPVVRFFKKGHSPISEASGHRKQVLVFQKENLPENYVLPEDANCQKVSLTMKPELLNTLQESTSLKLKRS